MLFLEENEKSYPKEVFEIFRAPEFQKKFRAWKDCVNPTTGKRLIKGSKKHNNLRAELFINFKYKVGLDSYMESRVFAGDLENYHVWTERYSKFCLLDWLVNHPLFPHSCEFMKREVFSFGVKFPRIMTTIFEIVNESISVCRKYKVFVEIAISFKNRKMLVTNTDTYSFKNVYLLKDEIADILIIGNSPNNADFDAEMFTSSYLFKQGKANLCIRTDFCTLNIIFLAHLRPNCTLNIRTKKMLAEAFEYYYNEFREMFPKVKLTNTCQGVVNIFLNRSSYMYLSNVTDLHKSADQIALFEQKGFYKSKFSVYDRFSVSIDVVSACSSLCLYIWMK